MRLDFQVSKTASVLLASLYFLGSYTAWQSGWPLPVNIALTFVLVSHAWFQLPDSLLLQQRSVVCIRFDGRTSAWLTMGGEERRACLTRVAYQSIWLTLLDFELVNNRSGVRADGFLFNKKIRVLVTIGSVSVSQRKQLICFLAYGP